MITEYVFSAMSKTGRYRKRKLRKGEETAAHREQEQKDEEMLMEEYAKAKAQKERDEYEEWKRQKAAKP